MRHWTKLKADRLLLWQIICLKYTICHLSFFNCMPTLYHFYREHKMKEERKIMESIRLKNMADKTEYEEIVRR